MNFTADEFYPTPSDVIREMLRGVKLNDVKSVLEPSAGKRNITKYLKSLREPNARPMTRSPPIVYFCCQSAGMEI